MVFLSSRSILAASLLWTTTLGQTGSLVQVSNFGTNPTNIQMYNYIPKNLAASPAVILALHYCGGSGPAYASMANYNTDAEKYGFITIYPSTTHDNNCWDVASAKSLTHEGGGDTQGLANMVKYVISKYNADPTRIYVTGSSSGGMMTNVMCAVYPDLFAAGSAYSGVAAGCLAGSPGASPSTADPTCANGNIRKSSAAWVSQVKAMYPSWTGSYPRFQTWHGTADNLVFYPNLEQQLLEWSGLLGVSFTKNNTNTPQSGYTQMVYGDGTKLIGYSAQGVGHTVPVHVPQDLAWFGIPGSGTGGNTGGGTTTTPPGSGTTTTPPGNGGGATTTPPVQGGTVAHWGQCGGQGWTGGTTCVSPYTCKYSNQYYSQCL